MLPRNMSKRGIWAVGAAFVFAFMLWSQSSRISADGPSHWGSSGRDRILGDINNSTLGFEKIFVIGMPSRTDRRDGMALQAALTNMAIEFVDGKSADEISPKAIPVTKDGKHTSGAALGAWRAHMDAIQEVVRRNLSSVLIMEDDVDWDVRLRQQLHDFALSSHTLTQPLASNPKSFADATYPRPGDKSPQSVPDIPFTKIPATLPPKWSPYGDSWDLLWIGHCGMHFPFANNKAKPKGRVVRLHDDSVPEQKHLGNINIPYTLVDKYPQHTRVVHHAQEAVCTLAYAVTQKAARQILAEIALQPVDTAYDILLRFFCDGLSGRNHHRCLTVQPALFQHHRPAGMKSSESDISDHGEGYRAEARTNVIRWSVRLNVEALTEGRTDYVDQFPDEK